MIKLKPMTINEIVDSFHVARNTARSWANHPEVEQVVGSWPPQFKRKNVFVPDEVPDSPVKEPNSPRLVRLPDVPKNQLEPFFRSILADEEHARFNFTEKFRHADTISDLNEIETALIASIVVTRYYKQLMEDEES
jgi:hypothetical protein